MDTISCSCEVFSFALVEIEFNSSHKNVMSCVITRFTEKKQEIDNKRNCRNQHLYDFFIIGLSF